MEEIKGIFEGDNAASNIEAVKGILKEKGYDVLDEEGKKAMFSENTKKAVSSVHESLGKRGLEVLKNEAGEEVKYSQQAFQHIDRILVTNKELQAKVKDLQDAQKSGDPEKLRVTSKALEETQKLLKAEQEKYNTQASEFEAKFEQQKKIDSVRGGLEGLKYKDNIKPEDLESAQAFAISQVMSMKMEDRNGVNVFLDENGDAIRDPKDATKYKSSSDMLKDKLSFMLDTHTPPSGTGTAGSTNYKSNENNSSNTYIYQGESNKTQLIRNMRAFGTAKGVEWSELHPQYIELAATHKLQS
jgi:hypothetical protein|tara:strand:+ start:4749 stop:5648 length:900 start_codon:yes stop_codon:yes gene_type:complete